MKKKIVILAALLVLFFSAHAFSVGIGLEGTGGYGAGNETVGGVWGTLKAGDLPYLGFGADFWGNSIRLGLTADWWLLDNKIAGPLKWYLGLGPYAGLTLGNPLGVSVGARLPIGLHIFPVKFLEVFAEIAPSIGINVLPGLGLDWGIRGAAGLRFWF